MNSHLQWAISKLKENGYKILSLNPYVIQDAPWSTVYRFNTHDGFVFLKKVPSALALEAKIIDVLQEQFAAPVPTVIAVSHDLNCFLMQDAGISLHDFFKEKKPEAEIIVRIMHDYINLQIQSAEKKALFLQLGVPDWRLEKLPDLYRELVAERQLLIEDGLTETEISALPLETKLIAICEKLSAYKIPETFSHADLHDKNILIKPDNLHTTLIDLGEVVVTHPFFSLVNCLHRVAQHFPVLDYDTLQSECIKSWLQFESEKNIFEIIKLIQQCWSIHAGLVEFRLMKSVPASYLHRLKNQGRLAKNLRYWID